MAGFIDVIESKLLSLVSHASPLLGTILAGPFSGVILSLLRNIFHVSGKDVQELADKIGQDPEFELKLKALENEHFSLLAKLAAKNYAIEVDDRKSARWREVSLRDYVPTILAIGFLINYAAIQFYCVTHPSNELDVISARFQDVLIMIMSYYFGSSHKNFNPKNS